MLKKIIPFALLIILVLAGVYFFFGKKNQTQVTPNFGTQVAQNLADTCPYDKDICTYFTAQAEAMKGGVTITTSSVMDEYGTSASEIKLDTAGNMEINSYKDEKLESSMIIFEKTNYIKDFQDGSWYVLGQQDEQDASQSALKGIEDTYNWQDGELQINKIGREACGNLSCDKFEMVGMMDNQTSKTYVWIDTQDHLARKMEYLDGNTSTLMEYQYGAVQISKPSLVKELPTFNLPSTDADTADQFPSKEELEQMMKQYAPDSQ